MVASRGPGVRGPKPQATPAPRTQRVSASRPAVPGCSYRQAPGALHQQPARVHGPRWLQRAAATPLARPRLGAGPAASDAHRPETARSAAAAHSRLRTTCRNAGPSEARTVPTPRGDQGTRGPSASALASESQRGRLPTLRTRTFPGPSTTCPVLGQGVDGPLGCLSSRHGQESTSE